MPRARANASQMVSLRRRGERGRTSFDRTLKTLEKPLLNILYKINLNDKEHYGKHTFRKGISAILVVGLIGAVGVREV